MLVIRGIKIMVLVVIVSGVGVHSLIIMLHREVVVLGVAGFRDQIEGQIGGHHHPIVMADGKIC